MRAATHRDKAWSAFDRGAALARYRAQQQEGDDT